jgi:radical SAM superfamily enzyme YgiQ (UPF0313 family)
MNKIALVSINAGRSDTRSHWPHYGLILLATILRKNGFDTCVFDQSFLGEPDDRFLERVAEYSPDICGISLYTTHLSRSLDFIQRFHATNNGCKIIAGGPHVSLYAQTLKENQPFFSAIVRGEAEQVIVDVCTKVLSGKDIGIIDTAPIEGGLIPEADFRLGIGSPQMKWRPIQLSRGCPFNCSFCDVREIFSRKIRYRNIERCLDEIGSSLDTFKSVATIRIVDDCPTLDRERFKSFLRQFISRNFRARISIDNLRADTVDEELLDLLKRCRIPYVCIAVESGNPDVFEFIQKGETIDDIVAAGRLIRKKRLPLYLCFIIGLPKSTFKAEMDSLRLAKTLKPDIIYWNMFLPHRGTRARDWFQQYGKIYSETDSFSVPSYDLTFTQPACETPEFSREERMRAYLICILETVSFIFSPTAIVRATVLAGRYRLWPSFFVMIGGIPKKCVVYARIVGGNFLLAIDSFIHSFSTKS